MKNGWKSLNPNVRALEDRAIILHFCPLNEELHRKVLDWFDDPEVYELLGKLRSIIPELSMRHYRKGAQLRRAGLSDWRTSLLQMVLPDSQIASVLAAMPDTTLTTEEQRAVRFSTTTEALRAAYFRIKAKLARVGCGVGI